MVRPSRPNFRMFWPSSNIHRYILAVLDWKKCARPKQDVFRPCSIKFGCFKTLKQHQLSKFKRYNLCFSGYILGCFFIRMKWLVFLQFNCPVEMNWFRTICFHLLQYWFEIWVENVFKSWYLEKKTYFYSELPQDNWYFSTVLEVCFGRARTCLRYAPAKSTTSQSFLSNPEKPWNLQNFSVCISICLSGKSCKNFQRFMFAVVFWCFKLKFWKLLTDSVSNCNWIENCNWNCYCTTEMVLINWNCNWNWNSRMFWTVTETVTETNSGPCFS